MGNSARDKAAKYISRTRNLSEVIKKIKNMKIEAMIVPHCGGRCCNLD
ncbi:MAG: hypothetical protein ACOCRB_02760 [Halanaerobiaceae bacterium]